MRRHPFGWLGASATVLSISCMLVFAEGSRDPKRIDRFVRVHAEGTSRPDRARKGQVSWPGTVVEGATVRAEGVRFVLRSENATRVELELFGSYLNVIEKERANALGVPTRVIAPEKRGPLWIADVSGIKAGEVYGYRVFGPNWPYDEAFKPGTSIGFLADVDAAGNRFNPNKLLIDPRAKAVTRDADWSQTSHVSGPKHRQKDSAAFQGKAIVVDDRFDWGGDRRPHRPLKDSVLYEVHLKGMTRRFPGIADPGTYKAMADDRVIGYLKDLGVTAVELLPIQETPNDSNDLAPGTTDGKNYWGYTTCSFFCPDRRYSSDQSADGPVREFKSMVKKYHAAGLEVLLDVVYNHTAEGGTWQEGPESANILSFRGVDNQLYYELTGDNRFFWDNTGCGGNVRTAYSPTGQFVIDSLRYWVDQMHVDGFRFDLASVLGNGCDKACFTFQRTGGLLERIAGTFGGSASNQDKSKGHIKLIAEPWAVGSETYQVGNYPAGWAEWNAKYRDTLRAFLKGDSTAGDLVERVNGSHGLFGDDGRNAHDSVNFVTAHDGLTLFDLVSFNVNSKVERDRLNLQPWPFGPSDGGEDHNCSWDCAIPGASSEEIGALRRQQARNTLTILMLSNGTPMLLGGDERLRSQHGNNNAYNLDNETSWLEWRFADRVNHLDGVKTSAGNLEAFHTFARNVIRLRQEFPGFHKAGWWAPDVDADGDGSPGVQWLGPSGIAPDWRGKHFAYRVDGAREELGMTPEEYAGYALQNQHLLVIVNTGSDKVEYKVPAPTRNRVWYRVVDTHSWAEGHGNFWSAEQTAKVAGSYGVNPHSVVVLALR